MTRIPSRLRRRLGLRSWPAGGVVLTYHRVACLESDPNALAVTPANFAAQLEIIVSHGHALSLERMLELAATGDLPPGATAVTFDDGYSDTLHEAAPALAAAGVPATVFVSTGAIDAGREFWWDEVERATVATPRDLPAYRATCDELRRLDATARERHLDSLFADRITDRRPRPTHRPLSADEVAALAACPGITVGSHTSSHGRLASLSPNEQRQEITSARRRLEAMTGRPALLFAYPFGTAADITTTTVAIAKAEGIRAACSTVGGTVGRDVDPWRVPRMAVSNTTADEFLARWLAWTGLEHAA